MALASPFTEEEQKWVILEFGAVRSIIQVRRNFRKAFKMAPKNVPSLDAFLRQVNRFLDRGEVNHVKPTCQPSISQKNRVFGGGAFKYKLKKT